MLAMSLGVALNLMLGFDLDLRISGESTCIDEEVFARQMVVHWCPNLVEPIDVRFDEQDARHCVAIQGTSAGCFDTCETTLQMAAVRAGEAIDHACAAGEDMIADAIEPEHSDEASSQPRARADVPVAPPRKPRLDLEDRGASVRYGYTATATSTTFGRSGEPIGYGMQGTLGLLEDGTQFSLIAAITDLDRTNWTVRIGLEVCRGRRYGRWEWDGCFGLGGGEFYTRQTASGQYQWGSVSNSARLHLFGGWGIRVDKSVLITVTDRQYGFRLDQRSRFNPLILVGLQYQFPTCRGNKRGRSCM